MLDYRYTAFICYSHQDESWATWVHRALESYRLPRKLIGCDSALGPVPKSLYPIFRDREELASATDLSDKVKTALEASAALIVVCSPHAAQSRWVNEEIRYFQSLGRGQRIYSVIISGDPESDDPRHNCFPQALVKDDSGRSHEPLSADARQHADGRILANLKLVSGILGISLEELRRRDLKRRRRQRILLFSGVTAGLVLLAVSVWFRVSAERYSDLSTQRLGEVERLVVSKLTELRTMFQVESDPEDLNRLKEWDKQELTKLIAIAGHGEGALIDSALTLRDQGKQFIQAGELAEALRKFEESWLLIAETYRRDPHNEKAFYELGQAEFWIGSGHLELGDLDRAEDALLTYAEITRRLVPLAPGKADYVQEVSYILGNLAVLQVLKDDNLDHAIQLVKVAIEYNQLALVLDPNNESIRSELGESFAWLADLRLRACDLEEAFESRRQAVSRAEEALQEDIDSTTKIRRLAYAHSGMATVQELLGRAEIAQHHLRQSLDLLEKSVTSNPTDHLLVSHLLSIKQRIAMMEFWRGNAQRAWDVFEAMEENWRELLRTNDSRSDRDSESPELNRISRAFASYLIDRAWLAQNAHESKLAVDFLQAAMDRLAPTLPKDSFHRRQPENNLTLATFRYWELTGVLPSMQVQAKLPIYSPGSDRVRGCTDANMAARYSVMHGNLGNAEEHTNYLLEQGGRAPDFLEFCKTYKLCESPL